VVFVYEVTFNTTLDMRPVAVRFAHDNQLKEPFSIKKLEKQRNLESLFSEMTPLNPIKSSDAKQ